MSDNVIPFGRSVNLEATLTPEDLELVQRARLEFQDFLFDQYEAPEIDTETPRRRDSNKLFKDEGLF